MMEGAIDNKLVIKQKKYIKNESPSCIQIVEEKNVKKQPLKHPDVCMEVNLKIQEHIKRLILADKDDTKEEVKEESDLESDISVFNKAPKFGTVIQNRIFVGGFSVKTTDEDLWGFFTTFSHVAATRIIYDRAGVSKCYGFVTFASQQHAKIIVKQSGGIMFSPMGRLRIAQAVRKQISQLQMISTEYGPVIPAANFLAASGQVPPSPESYFIPATPPKSLCSYHIICQGGSTSTAHCSAPPANTATTTGPTTSPESQTPRVQYSDGFTAPGVYACPGSSVTLVPAVGVQSMSYETQLPTYDATGLYTTCPNHVPYGHILMPTGPVPGQYPPVGYPYQEAYPYDGMVAWYPGLYGGIPAAVGKSHPATVPPVNHVQPVPIGPTYIY